MHLLVTGGAGFIGSHMAQRLLKDGHAVTIIDNESTGRRENVPRGARYIRGDVRQKEELALAFEESLDGVFHIAGQASTIRSFDKPMADLGTNVQGTIQVIQMCLEHRVERMLFASSMTAYGTPRSLPIDEEQPLMPVSYYGISKLAAERYVHATAARNDLQAPFRPTSFRMFNVYGERQSLENPYQGVAAIFIANMLREEPITIFGDGEQSRDFVHIEDVVEAWVGALADPRSHGQVYNLGAGERRSLHQLIDALLGSRGRSREDYPIRYQAERPGDQRHMQAAIGKIGEELGWQPRVPFDQGMARTVRWAEEVASRGLSSR